MGQQLQAARTYAGQLADLLDARPQRLINLKQALQTFPGLPFILTNNDISKSSYNLATQGLTANQQQIFTELGLDAHGRAQALNAMVLSEFPTSALPQDPAAQFPDFLTDPNLIASSQKLATALMDFSLGKGWKLSLPLIVR